MQFTRSAKTASLSPMRNKRQSVGFVNDYATSEESNIAPAATSSSPNHPKLRNTPPQSGFLQSKKNQHMPSTDVKGNDEWTAPFTKLSNRFLRRAKESDPSPRRTRPHQPQQEVRNNNTPPKQSKKNPDGKSGKEKRRVFQKLSDEKLPDYQKFKNRKSKSDYIKNKFGAMDCQLSDNTVSTETSLTWSGSVNSDFPSAADVLRKEEELDEDFVAGLIYFAPTSETEIRGLVAKRPPAA
eukprot:CAMPEP_0119013396 /NCGR_PEP_ID=MMETSP1176-20130426/8430_1 /TAXON_ID=265551 /ORGANISM="Synedropsis recta cf, Strain CCMP1620" /LENGTH=238 /DNA_ID=CAMNT_0006966485 /DNA_START=56 /DNA_END=772 /DNA_ORIENTATION=+